MSRLEEMIGTLCPDGVEYKPLGDVVNFINGRAYKQSELLDEGKYKVLRVGNFYTNDKWYYSNLELDDDKYCNHGDLLYTWAATIGPQIWNGERAIYHYHIWKLEFDEKIFSKMFLYYFLCKDVNDIFNSLTNSTMPHVSMGSMKKRMIPIPPMEVQREIVRILDNFTELAEKLTVELTSRKQQYEYYKADLFSFKKDIKSYTLGDVCEITSGGTPSKKHSEYWNDGTIKWLGSTICKGEKSVNEITGYITEEGLAKSSARLLKPKTTLIALVGATIGKVAFLPFEAVTNQNVVALYPKDTEKLNPSYLFYACTLLYPQFTVLTQGSKLAMANLSFVRSLQIQVPPIEIQCRIVKMLDCFEMICDDYSEGLPAEIEARQKQYEYYRNKLLTFKEKIT